MRNLWLAATLAIGVAVGGWSLPKAEADHPHCDHGHGYSAGYHGHSHAGYGHRGGYHSHGYGADYGPYGTGYGSSYGVYRVAPRVSIANVYQGGYAPYYQRDYFRGGYAPYYSGYSPYGLGSGLGVGVYSSGYRGLGYSNFGGPSVSIGGLRLGF